MSEQQVKMVILSTDEVEGLSELDVKLAHAVDEIAPARDRRR